MRQRLNPLIILLGALLLCQSAAASEPGITAVADRLQTDLQSPIVFTVTVTGSQAAQPTLPDLSAFDVQSHGHATNIAMVNGHFSRSVTQTFVLTPKKAGSFPVGPATVQIDGKQYESEPFVLQVSAAPAAAPDGAQDSGIFITGEVSNKAPYVGEQFVYTWRFFRRERVGTANVTLPEFGEFINEPLGERREFESLIKGQRYAVTEIRRALFAQAPGPATLDGASLQCEVFTGDRGDGFGSPLDTFFGHGARQTRQLHSPPIALRVQPIPSPPVGFADLVGSLALQASVGQNDLKVGDSTTLTLSLTGTGTLKQAAEPSMPPLPSFKVYDDRPAVQTRVQGQTLQLTKIFRKALVPSVPGDLQVGPFSLTYFDPSSRTFKVATAQALTLHVAPGEGGEGGEHGPAGAGPRPSTALGLRPEAGRRPGAGGAAAKVDVQVLNEDILPLYRRQDALDQHRFRQVHEVLWGVVFGLPVSFFIAMLALSRHQRQSSAVEERRRRAGALRTALQAHRAWQSPGGAASAPDSAEVAHQASRLLRQYLGTMLGTEGLALTAAEVRQALLQRGLPEPLAQRAEAFLQRCEAVQYGAPLAAGDTWVAVAKHLKDLLTQLDGQLK
jgi:hypothetical protein